MPHYGTLQQHHFGKEAEEIRGANVYGADNEKLGTIDDVIFDHETGEIEYAVVDTGGWLRSKRFVVPAGRIHASREHPEHVATELLKQQVERFPEYNEESVRSEKEWSEYEDRYRAVWNEGPVLHQEGTDRSVTPRTEEIPVDTGGDRSIEGRDLTPERLTPKFQPLAPQTLLNPSGPVNAKGPRTTGVTRWDKLATTLRSRREELVRDCPGCPPRKERVA